MESLALLCTLHADGPATLKRLRRAGCDSLKTIEGYGAADLATLLEVPPAVARRLLKEARVLSARLDDGVLDDAEEAPQVCTGPAPYPASGSTPGPQVTTQGFLDQRDYAILGRVLEHWSDEAEADAVDSQVGSSAPLPPAAEVASEMNSGIESERLWPEDPSAASCGMDEERAEEAECTADAPSGAPPLRAGDFEGLDEAMIAALGGAHIESLSDVLEADALVLAEILGVTYANARRTQYLARAAEPKAEVMAEPMAEVAADPPVSIDAPDPEPNPSPVSLAFGARWRESAPSPSGEDSSPARKFWEPRPSAAAVAPDPGSEELVIEMRVPSVEAADAPSAEVPTAEERVSAEEGPGADAKPEATPEPACEPSDDPGPKRVPPESPMPDAATYGTPWPQDAGPELTRPLHVRFPSEPPEPEAMQAEDAVTAQGSDRPLNWNFDLTGPSVRFPENAPGEPPSGYSAAGHSADDPGRDGVGGPFA
jgi:hypothetical protein